MQGFLLLAFEKLRGFIGFTENIQDPLAGPASLCRVCLQGG